MEMTDFEAEEYKKQLEAREDVDIKTFYLLKTQAIVDLTKKIEMFRNYITSVNLNKLVHNNVDICSYYCKIRNIIEIYKKRLLYIIDIVYENRELKYIRECLIVDVEIYDDVIKPTYRSFPEWKNIITGAE